MRVIGLYGLVSLLSSCTCGSQVWNASNRHAILNTIELTLTEGSSTYTDPLDKTVTVRFQEVDLNSDNVPELIVCIEGSLYLSGVTGQSCGVYQISKYGIIKELMLVPAFSIEVAKHIYNGYSVLKVQPRGEPKLWCWKNGGYSIIFDIAGTVK